MLAEIIVCERLKSKQLQRNIHHCQNDSKNGHANNKLKTLWNQHLPRLGSSPTVECISHHKPPDVFVQNWLQKVAMEEGYGPFHYRMPGLLGGMALLQKQGMGGIRVKQTVMWASYRMSLGFLHGTFHRQIHCAHHLLSGQYRLRGNWTAAWYKRIALGLGIMGTWMASDSGIKPTGE